MPKQTGHLGTHWVANADGCSTAAVTEAVLLRALNAVPVALGLSPVAPPITHVHPDGSVAGVVLIAESHMSLHGYPDRKLLHIDLFSCAPFDVLEARSLLQKFFTPTAWEETLLERTF